VCVPSVLGALTEWRVFKKKGQPRVWDKFLILFYNGRRCFLSDVKVGGTFSQWEPSCATLLYTFSFAKKRRFECSDMTYSDHCMSCPYVMSEHSLLPYFLFWLFWQHYENSASVRTTLMSRWFEISRFDFFTFSLPSSLSPLVCWFVVIEPEYLLLSWSRSKPPGSVSTQVKKRKTTHPEPLYGQSEINTLQVDTVRLTCIPELTQALYKSHPLPLFLSFFLGFRRPNLITGLRGWQAPDYPLRTQEPVAQSLSIT